ncbi:unnamed protein product [Blepharisma stoltei]|uniref:Uncharacterized protein n=1 Tax=Blepharisma stoltei TaxID=1481888 RepID=A0AAU9JLR9_9CILI|nr:unnamed protein product [Blepharisma stoltei]
MSTSVHFFTLLSANSYSCNLKVPETIILGFGFPKPTYMKNTEHNKLEFLTIEKEDIIGIISNWVNGDINSPIMIVKSLKGNTLWFSTEEIENIIKGECIIQQFICNELKYSIARAIWDYQKGHTLVMLHEKSPKIMIPSAEPSVSTEWSEHTKENYVKSIDLPCPVKLKSYLESMKIIINKKLKSISCRLEHLELDFIKSTNHQYYCTGIHNYSYGECNSLLRFSSLENTSKSKLKQSRHISTSSMPSSPFITSPISTPDRTSANIFYAPNVKIKQTLDSRIRKHISDKGIIGHMSYNFWKNKIDNGEKMLPNEEKYAKLIASHSTRVLIETSQDLKVVKSLAHRMQQLIDRKQQRNLNDKEKTIQSSVISKERQKALTRLERRIIRLKTIKILPEAIQNTAKNTVNDAAMMLDFAKSSIKRSQ